MIAILGWLGKGRRTVKVGGLPPFAKYAKDGAPGRTYNPHCGQFVKRCAVNLREGTRRLALLLGVTGAILAGFASYMELQTVLNQRARHNRFEQLATSEVVQQERKNLQLWKPVIDPKTGEPIQFDPKTG